MKVINFSEQNTIINQFIAEMRDVEVQKDRARFRFNLSRVGQMMAYEISKTLDYSQKTIQTPLAKAQASTPDNKLVLSTIFRAGILFHQGFLDVFDRAENAFVSAFRFCRDQKTQEVDVKVEYLASPDLTDKTLILVDPMLATGGSFEMCYRALCTQGTPAHVHFCSVVAAQKGVDHLKRIFADNDRVTLWCAVIDPELNERSYIVPGLGDAGDLAFGEKL